MNAPWRTLVRVGHTGVLPALLAAGAVLLGATPASAATVLGSATGGSACVGSMDTVQLASSPLSYSVPAGGGTITSWSTTASLNIGSAGLLVWRPTATPGTYTLVAATAPTTLVAGTNVFNLTTPIAVQAGDVLGLHTQGRMDCAGVAASGNTIGYFIGATAAVGGQEKFTTDPAPLTVDISATVQPASSGGGGGKGRCKDKPGRDEPDWCDRHDHDRHHDHDGKDPS